MRKLFLPFVLLLAAPLFMACSSELEDLPDMQQPVKGSAVEENAVFMQYPPRDDAKSLPENGVEALQILLEMVDTSRVKQMGETRITDEQFAEIKKFVDENLAAETGAQTYQNIFSWVVKNLSYAWNPTPAYLDPYDVFIHRTCVCQGYANLLKTMMLTQGLPACCVNGQLVNIGAHAWNYVHDGEQWWVSDPTNNQHFPMKNTSEYVNKLVPSRADFLLFEDDCFGYGFTQTQLNINEVKEAAPAVLSLPRSIAGYKIARFEPQKKLPKHITTLGIPTNITNFSEYSSSMLESTPGVEEVLVEDGHSVFESYKGIVYEAGSKIVAYIPTAIKIVELKSRNNWGKNLICNLPEVTDIYISKDVKTVQTYAIENCPKLERVHVSRSTTLYSGFIYRCPADVEIIYDDATSIDRVTM